jgi:hypothetical protein
MTKIRIVIVSHLNDAEYDLENNPYMFERRMKFIKFLLDKYPNTDTEVDDDEIETMWYHVSDLY